MPRPSKPLISRSAAVAAALEIIDAEGLESFSVPRLAKHLGVQAPSLYYHFADKAELMSAIALQVIGDVSLPRRKPGPDWPEYFVTLGLNFRQGVLRHRRAAPVLLQALPRTVLLRRYEDAAQFLAASEVPAHLHIQILDGMERLTLGAVLTEAVRSPSGRATIFPNVDAASEPALTGALAANDRSSKRLYEEMIRSFLHGVVRDEPAVAPAG
ncbi:TetR family transcriptional regulator [Nocardia sp. BMG111209]|uniref:TetR family transcriptional regulator n=1 Tax=Nocardia sp. BMG111209 TaxID=1160137 RepID=UPI000399AB7B|nr:TetR family transcriptional regulator [Nocardia sp. BMG111209]